MTQDANPPPASSNPTWIELSKFIEDQNAVSRAIIDRWFTLAAKVLGVLVFAITFGLGIFGWKTLNDATATAQIVATQTARDEATRVATEVASKTAESAASRVAAEQVKLIMQDPHVQKLISDTAGQLFREGAYRQTVEKAVHDQMQDAITNGVIGNYVVSYNGIPNQSLGIRSEYPRNKAKMNLSSDWQLTATKLESQITEFAVLLVGKVGAELHPIGSGVFIAAGLVMTAKHVIAEFWTRLGPGTPFSGGDEKKGFFDIVIVQYPGEKAEAALWLTSIGFGAKFSDIAFLSVKPANDLATSYKFSRLPMLNALPPAVGERVFGFGYPSSEVLKSTEELMQFALHPTTTSGFVTTIYPEYRDRGMLTFPCFEINTHFIGGMSGGPLYNEAGQLCGLICASQNDQPIAYGATLWASLGTNITHEFDGITCTGPAPVFELATIGRMFLTGWDEIVPRIEIQHDPFGKELLRLKATT